MTATSRPTLWTLRRRGVPVGHAGARVDIAEQRVWCLNGFAALLIGLLLVIGALAAFVWGAAAPRGR